MAEHDARTCDGCLMLTMMTRAEKAEAALTATWEALDKASALRPDDFKTGQDHLPPAFREVDFRAAFKAMVDVVNDIERASGYADRLAATTERTAP